MRIRLSSVSLGLLLIASTICGYFITANTASAVGSAADAMCTPVIQQCGCGQIPNPKGGCMGGANMFMCPCTDMTSGFSTNGVCVAQTTCQAQSTGGGNLTQLSQLMQTLGQLMQQLGQGGGGGDGGGSGTGGSAGCTTFKQTSDQNNTDPCSYYVPGIGGTGSNLLDGATGTTGGSSAISDLLASLVGSNSTVTGNTNTNTPTNTNTSGSTSTTSGNTSGSSVNSVIASISNPQDLKPGTSAAVSQSAFGNAPGVTGDIQVLSGNRVTMLASNRDIAGNKQTSGFSGFMTSVNLATKDIYVQVCSARQWANNFLTIIIPISYFDNLCTSHGYSINPPALQSATPPPAPPPPSAPKATSTPPYIGPMKADIWVSPATITKNSRTSLFWSASGVLACQISGPSGVFGSALSGNAAVGPLINDTTYSIACQSATSTITKQATVTVQ